MCVCAVYSLWGVNVSDLLSKKSLQFSHNPSSDNYVTITRVLYMVYMYLQRGKIIITYTREYNPENMCIRT